MRALAKVFAPLASHPSPAPTGESGNGMETPNLLTAPSFPIDWNFAVLGVARDRPSARRRLFVSFPSLRRITMGTSGLRKCPHCGNWFHPRGRNAWHQHYCPKAECRAASKRASQRKWCRKNPGYFHGEDYVKKVQAWRRNHPGYWKPKERPPQPPSPPDALQDLLVRQGFEHKGVSTLRDCLAQEISRPLQELVSAQQHVLTGLAAMIAKEPLQETIAHILSTCYEHGRRIGGRMPWMPPVEDRTHAPSRNPDQCRERPD